MLLRISNSVTRCGGISAKFARSFSSVKSIGPDSIVVQKFGGTSLGTPEKMDKVANIITSHYSEEENKNVVAVVSALSSETKEEGTTSRLLAAAEAAVKQEAEFQVYLERIEDTHMDIIYSLNDRKIRDNAKHFVHQELDRTRSFCSSLGVIREISPRSHDMVIGCGERLSAGLISYVLRDRGVKAEYVNLSGAFQELDTGRRGYQHTAKRVFGGLLKPLLEENTIPVVSGFFGNVNKGIIKGVGRGYTDLTSALCAGAVNADALQVWKESDGVFTGNPTKIDEARLLSLVTPEEASELTYFGNEVLHPFTMECAIEDRVPIHILNTFKPDSGGTAIVEADHEEELGKLRGAKCQGIAAVCSKKGIPVINLMSNRLLDSTSFLARVFEKFAQHKVKADLISTSVSNLTVTLHETTPRESIDALLKDLEQYGKADFEENRAIVSCIGSGMRHQTGLASRVFHVLAEAGISLEMISQGASEINISAVIPSEDMDKAIHTIHRAFLEEK